MGYKVKTADLEASAKYIQAAYEEGKSVSDLAIGNTGMGFTALRITAIDSGSKLVSASWDASLQGLGYWYQTLMKKCDDFSKKLNLSAGLYAAQEKYHSDTLRTLYADVASNPHLTQEQVLNRSNAEMWADNPISNFNPMNIVHDANNAGEAAHDSQEILKDAWHQHEQDNSIAGHANPTPQEN